MTKDVVFQTVQMNGNSFRAELVRLGPKWVAWVAESEEEVYAVTIDQILRIDTYLPKTGTDTKVIVLYRNDQEVETVEIGNFSKEDAVSFISWLQSTIYPPRVSLTT